jgi:hypothetical protein
MTKDTVEVLKTEYLRLLEDSLVLEQLRKEGVDNWPGHDCIDWGHVNDTLAGAQAVLEVGK